MHPFTRTVTLLLYLSLPHLPFSALSKQAQLSDTANPINRIRAIGLPCRTDHAVALGGTTGSKVLHMYLYRAVRHRKAE